MNDIHETLIMNSASLQGISRSNLDILKHVLKTSHKKSPHYETQHNHNNNYADVLADIWIQTMKILNYIFHNNNL